MAQVDPFSASLDLLRRLPPTRVEENLSLLCSLQPELADDLLSAVDQPLKIAQDGETGKEYLCCDFNKDGDSFRSPWSNKYTPALTDGSAPSAKLRQLEIAMNEAFDTYREMYYEGGNSSVYLWDLEDGGFAGVVLMKKTLSSTSAYQGSWDSIHVFEVRERGRQAHYSLTSTVLLWINTQVSSGSGQDEGSVGDVSLSGSMTRQIEQDLPVTSQQAHIVNCGRIIEDMDFGETANLFPPPSHLAPIARLKMRNSLSEVYFGKTKDVINELRSIEGSGRRKQEADIRNELMGVFKKRG